MRELDYRSLLPEISMPRVKTLINDETLVDVLKDDGYISCPDIPLSFVVDVLKSYNIVYDYVFYFGTSLSVHLYFKVLPLSLAASIISDLRRKFQSSVYYIYCPHILSFGKDKVNFKFFIYKKK